MELEAILGWEGRGQRIGWADGGHLGLGGVVVAAILDSLPWGYFGGFLASFGANSHPINPSYGVSLFKYLQPNYVGFFNN